ncbi:MAG: cytochrome c [Pseudomonadota bacterium]
MKRTTLFLFLSISGVIASTALAHQGVKDPQVMARMHTMKAIGEAVKVLGDMAKGVRAFDIVASQEALDDIARHARETPALFAPEADDPKSEARPEIWQNFEDFTRKSKELESISVSLRASFSGSADLRPALMRIGENCKSCHAIYRE